MEPNEAVKEDMHRKLRGLVENDTAYMDKDKENVLKKLPESFWKFMKERGINIEEVLVEVPRFVRLKRPQLKFKDNHDQQQKANQPQPQTSLQDLINDLAIKQTQIVLIDPLCYALAPSCKINYSKHYQEAKLYGMDVSSMFAVKCLDLQKDSTLLELCSAPGNKSMYACDLQPQVKVTGVEINQTRANVMSSLISKYGLDHRIQVVVEDATKYQSKELYDRVLVDAQCTHEGSVKHLKKFTKDNEYSEQNTKKQNKQNKQKTKQQQKQFEINHNPYTSQYDKRNEWSVQDFQKRFLDPIKLDNLYELQLNLIRNGFKMLKPGGIMVYSTCSIDHRQNENIVGQLLKQNEGEVVLLDAEESLGDCPLFFRKGTFKETVYFTPKLSMCGGMFISKIKKVKKDSKTELKQQQQVPKQSQDKQQQIETKDQN